MKQVPRTIVVLQAAALASFGLLGSAVPGFSEPIARVANLIGATILMVLLWFPVRYHRVYITLAVSVVGYIIARGALAYAFGGQERVGVFFQNAVIAVTLATIFGTRDVL